MSSPCRIHQPQTHYCKPRTHARPRFSLTVLDARCGRRIKFAEIKDIEKKWGGAAALPEIHGGEKKLPTAQWVDERLAAFPLMGLPSYEEAVTDITDAVKDIRL